MSSWPEVLDELSARIDVAEAALDSSEDLNEVNELVEPFSPPEGLGELPSELLERAQDLLRRQYEVELRLTNVKEIAGRELSKLAAAGKPGKQMSPFAEQTVSRYFDSAV